MSRLTADFETTVDPDDCRVWAWATCDIDEIDRREVLRFGNSIESFFDYLKALDDSKVWFHNLKFDGEFIYNYLLDNGWAWVDSIDMSAPRTFSTLISDKGQHYCIDLRFTWRHTVRVLDSLKVIPMPVAKIPKAFGLADAKLELDYKGPRERGHELTEDEIAYITEDVVITAKAMRVLLDEGEDGRRDFIVVHGYDVVHELLAIIERVNARFLHGDAVGDGTNTLKSFYLPMPDGVLHTWRPLCLHAIDLNPRVQLFDGKGYARNQSASADGDNHRVGIGQLLEEFQSDSPLSGNHVFIIKRMDKCISFFVAQLESTLVSIIIDAFHEAYVGTQCFRGFYL